MQMKLEIYALEPERGLLADTGKRIELGKPVCIQLHQPF